MDKTGSTERNNKDSSFHNVANQTKKLRAITMQTIKLLFTVSFDSPVQRSEDRRGNLREYVAERDN